MCFVLRRAIARGVSVAVASCFFVWLQVVIEFEDIDHVVSARKEFAARFGGPQVRWLLDCWWWLRSSAV